MLPVSFAVPALAGDALHQLTIDGLSEYGWSQQNFFLPDDLTLALAAECRALNGGGALAPASVGRGAAQALRPEIRSDSILWLNAGQSAACDRYLLIMDDMRMVLNPRYFSASTNTKA